MDTPGPSHESGRSCCPSPVALTCCPAAFAPPDPTSCPPGRETPRMSLHGLLDAVVKDAPLAEAIRAASDGHRSHIDLVGPPAARPFAVAALARDAG
ncbi:hypothetical protein, partial [Streptomyces scabiei]